ncbi:MAG TPA: caspase family protein, partial [Dehalococcoidia bacterium]|nr:caspase family protein [Dehalococcoidia bacterium]
MVAAGHRAAVVEDENSATGESATALSGEAWDEWLSNTYRTMVYQYARSRLVDTSASEKLTAEVFRVARRRLRRGHPHRQDLGGFLIGIARRLANQHEDLLRRSTTHWSPPLDSGASEGQYARRQSAAPGVAPSDYPDRQASRAVLVGASQYGTLPELTAARRGAERLAEVLAGILDRRHITVLQGDAVTRAGVLNALAHAADQATDTLLFYFCGHGLAEAN